jgi:hypothetical protein
LEQGRRRRIVREIGQQLVTEIRREQDRRQWGIEGRCNRGGLTIPKYDMEAIREKRGFKAYLETRACLDSPPRRIAPVALVAPTSDLEHG